MNKIVLNYDELVKAYWENLTTTLRGFRPGAEFLDMWVPDEEPIRSITNLLEVAQMSGQEAVTITLEPSTVGQIDLESLVQQAGEFGKVMLETQSQKTTLEVTHLKEFANLQRINPVYRASIFNLLNERSHEGALDASEGFVKVQETQPEATLVVLVNATNHMIERAAYDNVTSAVDAALLEKLCDILPGLTILEAAEHSTIHLEYQLRQSPGQRPVAGIVTPPSADSIFQLPKKLTQLMLAQYRETTGFVETENDFEFPPAASWVALSDDEKLTKLSMVVDEFCQSVGLSMSEINVVDLAETIKVTVGFGESVPVANKPDYMRQLEKQLKANVERTIQLYMQEKKDLNRTRRLA